jgi:nitrogen fixation protein FixH
MKASRPLQITVRMLLALDFFFGLFLAVNNNDRVAAIQVMLGLHFCETYEAKSNNGCSDRAAD